MTEPLNLLNMAEKLRKTFKDEKKSYIISTGENMKTPKDPSDFVVMPDWWKKITGTLGIPYGFFVIISGAPDSGKTSATIMAMKCAQSQNCYVILADTEKKTTKSRFENWGVDPTRIALVQPDYLEEMYDGIDMWWEAIREKDPTANILIVIDSIAMISSKKEANYTMEEDIQIGTSAKANRRGLDRLRVRLRDGNAAVLIINQTYDNIMSHGKSNKGGRIVDFSSYITFQTARKKWLEKISKGETFRVGAQVVWTLYKNHSIDAENTCLKNVLLNITSEGISLADS